MWQKTGLVAFNLAFDSDNRIWKIIISPEFAERIDLTRLARDLTERLEKDLHTQLEWVAVGQFNTEHPHLRVALRGVGKDGEKFRLPRTHAIPNRLDSYENSLERLSVLP
jgi:type IV secretory pathway VirD2 relaxase